MPLLNLAPVAAISELNTLATQIRNAYPPLTVTLIGGQDDESPEAANCTISPDTVNYKVGDRGWTMTISGTGSVVSQLILDPPGTDDPLTLPHAAAIGGWFYLPEVAKVDQVGIHLFSDSGLTQQWTYNQTSLVSGWNMIRVAATTSSLSGWNTVYRVRVVVVTNAPTNLTVAHVWAECPKKAQVLFIADGPYEFFYTRGYSDLARRKVPVTFACVISSLGTTLSGGTSVIISGSTLITLAQENENEVNFHTFDGLPTDTRPASGIRADTMKCIKWMERHEFWKTRIWRSAWFGNSAQNHSAARPLLLAYATPSGTSTVSCWPPVDRYNLPRVALHGLPQALVDDYFSKLEITHGILICYTHGIDEGGGIHMTPTEWSYFLSKLDQGMNAGWLEGVTFTQLVARSGLKFLQTFGVWDTDYHSDQGVERSFYLP